MQLRRSITPAIALISCISFPAWAELTGNDLLALCKDQKLACVAYIHGYSVGLQQGAVFGFLYERTDFEGVQFVGVVNRVVGICPPDGVSPEQTADVLIKYLEENPEVRHESLTIVTYDALSNAFPCE